MPDTDVDEEVDEPRELFICTEEMPDGSVCGEELPDAMRLGTHKLRAHGIPGKHRKTGPADKRPTGRPKGSRNRPKQPVETTAAQAVSHTNRTAIYTQSLALVGLAAHLAVPPFDEQDLDVWSKGVPGLAAALDALGQQSPAVRTACDLILGGGSGAPILQLILAVAAIAAPIAAHHGAIPESVGVRFGSMTGATVAPPPAPPTPAPEGAPRVYDPNSIDDFMAFMEGTPPTVMAEVAGRMMGGAAPTVVGVPTFMEPDGDRPEQPLAPGHPTVPVREEQASPVG